MSKRNNQICGNEEWLAAYIDKKLSTSERLFYEKHLSNCPTCLAEFIAATKDLEEMSDFMNKYRETKDRRKRDRLFNNNGTDAKIFDAISNIFNRISPERLPFHILPVASAIIITVILSFIMLSPAWDPDVKQARLNTKKILEENYMSKMRLSDGRKQPVEKSYTLRGPAENDKKLFLQTETMLRKSIDLYPEEVDLYNMLGNLYQAKNRVEHARTQYLKGLRLDPDNPETLNNIAVISYRLNRNNEAISYLNKALLHEDAPSIVYYNLTLLHQENGNIDEMISNGKIFLQKDNPSSPWSCKIQKLINKYQ